MGADVDIIRISVSRLGLNYKYVDVPFSILDVQSILLAFQRADE